MRVTLIGEAPRRRGQEPFEGRSGDRLRKLVGAECYDQLQKANLFQTPQPRAGRGWSFNLARAREAVVDFDLPRGVLLLAGKRLAAAFGIDPDHVYFVPWSLRGRPAFVVPHPSGTSRWWNDPMARARAVRFFRRTVVAAQGDEQADWRAAQLRAAERSDRVVW